MNEYMDSQIVWSSPWFSIEEIQTREAYQNSSKYVPYYRIKAPDAVAILPVTTDGKFVFVRQFRPAVGRYVIEVPAGGIEKGENPENAAVRELAEETGYRSVEALIALGHGSMSAGRFSNTHYWFVALNVEPIPNWHSEEGIERVIIDPVELKNMYDKDFIDGLMNIAILTLAQNKLGKQIPKIW